MNYNILIVDDVMLNRKLMRKVLSNTTGHFSFYDAENGQEAIDMLKKEDIDLVILDLMMPIKDGYEVLGEMKKQDRYKDIPVIVNSAITDMDSIKKTLELGATDYFTKPITPDQMEVIIPLKAINALKYYEQKKSLKKINKKIQEELKIATMLQKYLIKGTKNFTLIDTYINYTSCDEVGGDLYDYVELEDEFWFVVADIKGRGVAAAMVSTMVKALFNGIVKYGKDPNQVLEEMNRTFCNMTDDQIDLSFSAFIGVIKDNVLTYANAGHPYPIIIHSKDKECKLLKLNGRLMGIFDDIQYNKGQVSIQKDDVLLVYTDGLYNLEKKEQKNNNILDIDLDTEYVEINMEKEYVLEQYMDHLCNFEQEKEMTIGDFNLVYDYASENVDDLLNDPDLFMTKLLEKFQKQDKTNNVDDVTIMMMKKK
ncbi:PP2C family protein-serine/threonine phosphatase [Inediibacterium massiliense]|uniref:PP2C family protein-serine/threonine phosphatase n=1 Tax=Inediibacterium massiliense TaxID=1658111 RepID=UPI0006B4511B|nr:fused response regulator/phosphatase [Inediibacterium massiliense]